MNNKGPGAGGNKKKNKLSPQQLAVVVGLLTDSLDVISLLIDKDQRIQIVLEGSIRKKTKADRVAQELNDISVSELINAYLRK
jgi:hypothetical protein